MTLGLYRATPTMIRFVNCSAGQRLVPTGDGGIGRKAWRLLRPLASENRMSCRCRLPYSTVPFKSEDKRRGVVMSMGKRTVQRLLRAVGYTAAGDRPVAKRPARRVVPVSITGRPLSQLSVNEIQAWYQYTMGRA